MSMPAGETLSSGDGTLLTIQSNIERIVEDVFPGRGMQILAAIDYKKTYLGNTTKLVLRPTGGDTEAYFLKTVNMGPVGSMMCEGEFESLKAIHEVSPQFAPRPVSWGQTTGQGEHRYFILEEFCEMGDELAGPDVLATGLADLHSRSQSPTGKFGFHVKTCHGPIVQQVDQWEDCWATFYRSHLSQYMNIAKRIMASVDFDCLCEQVLDRVVPRLLLPLQGNGRILKPSLIHGDCWDGNTALDRKTGQALVFDACSFYGHNEYDIGNWRAPRHKFSAPDYLEAYQKRVPVSEPAEDWNARNILYSLSFNIGNIINIANSDQRDVVIENMKWLCAECLD